MNAYNLDTARRHADEVTALYLHNCGLTAVPEVVFRCPNLRILEISANPLEDVPPMLGELSNLEELILENNRILSLPSSISRLHKLHRLGLSGNPLALIPVVVFELPALRRLDLARTGIDELPAGIGRLGRLESLDLAGNRIGRLPAAMERLRLLRYLNLSGNRLRTLPAALGSLSHLERLDASQNRLSALPSEWLRGWPRLQQLLLNHNTLGELPEAIGDCVELRRIHLSRNRLAALPAALGELRWLTDLDLSRNRLISVPPTIERCHRLQRLDLSHNALSNLPAVIDRLSRLTTLHLDHNNLSRLPPLPPSLTTLTAMHNRLTDFPDNLSSLRRLQNLALNANPIARESPELLLLDELSRYRPPARETGDKDRLLPFLRACRKDQTPDDLRAALYAVFQEKPAALDSLSLSQLFRALHFPLRAVALAVRAYLTRERGRPFTEQPLRAGAQLAIAGQTPFQRERLRRRLTAKGITLSTTLDGAASHVLVDLKPRNYEGFLHDRLVFLSPDQLDTYLDRQEGGSPSEQLDERQLDRLRRLLAHAEAANVRLAVQLLRGGGVPSSLITDLFVAWKRALRGSLRTDLRRLLEINLPEADRRLLSWRLPLSGAPSTEELVENIRRYSEGTVLDGERMRELLDP